MSLHASRSPALELTYAKRTGRERYILRYSSLDTQYTLDTKKISASWVGMLLNDRNCAIAIRDVVGAGFHKTEFPQNGLPHTCPSPPHSPQKAPGFRSVRPNDFSQSNFLSLISILRFNVVEMDRWATDKLRSTFGGELRKTYANVIDLEMFETLNKPYVKNDEEISHSLCKQLVASSSSGAPFVRAPKTSLSSFAE
uniref:Uncharacterized protein n=1 Tax=Romanomermis culicivorax TaxID=13658 RepID=A0A915K085_ROMCU